MDIIAYHRLLVKSSKSLINSGFIAVRSPYKEGVTEQLNADNQMLWVAKTNNIRNRAAEIVNTELIYT